MRSSAARIAFVVTVLALRFTAAYGQAPVRIGVEFQVNTYTTLYQGGPAVDVESNGDFVVVWTSTSGQDGAQSGVFGQRFTSSGGRLGGEFQVNTRTSSYQSDPAIGVDPDGDFVVVWESSTAAEGFGIVGQRFDSSGAPVATEFAINQYTIGDQRFPEVAIDASGAFVVAWTSDGQDGSSLGVFVRRFASQGTLNEFRANTYVTSHQYAPALGVDADGDFVVVWQSSNQDGNSSGIFGQRFDSLGAALGSEFRANHVITGIQNNPSVSLDTDGDFVVVWSSGGYLQSGSGYDIFARPFDSNGVTITLDVLINDGWQGDQRRPSIRLDDDGDFSVVWVGVDGDGTGVGARRFKSGVLPTSADFLVNSHTPADQGGPEVASTPDGDFIVVWSSSAQDGSSGGVFAQRFRVGELLDVDGNGELGPLTDGLLMLRYLFGFTGNTLITGAVGPGCTRCDSAAIETYLQQLP